MNVSKQTVTVIANDCACELPLQERLENLTYLLALYYEACDQGRDNLLGEIQHLVGGKIEGDLCECLLGLIEYESYNDLHTEHDGLCDDVNLKDELSPESVLRFSLLAVAMAEQTDNFRFLVQFDYVNLEAV